MKFRTAITMKALEVKEKLVDNTRGEGRYVDTVKILISVVIGALLMTGLYALFNDSILSELQNRIQQMFSYGG